MRFSTWRVSGIAEARDALSHGDTQTLRAATQTAALLHTWCGG